MKKILLVFLLIYCATILKLKAQVHDTTHPIITLQFDPGLLFQKARKQNTIAWILLPAVIVMTAAGSLANFGYSLYGSGLTDSKKYLWISYLGIGTTLASIPFFLKAGKNKRKANFILKHGSESFSRLLHYKENLFSFGINIRT